MAEPLATSDDVVERLGRALTSSESAKIDAILVDVSAAIRAYTGQSFTLEETTELCKIRNGGVRLSQRPVVDVSAVDDGNGNSLSFEWLEGDGRVSLTNSGYLNEWELNIAPGTRVGKASVTYEHGYDTMPNDIIGLACHLTSRALGTPSTQSGITQESITNYSYTIGSAAGAGPFGLLPEEKRTLDRYRVWAGSISTW